MSWPRPSEFDNNGHPHHSSQPNKTNKAKNNEKDELQDHVEGKENHDVNPQDHEKKDTGEEVKAGSRKKKVQRQKWVPLPLHEARQELKEKQGSKTSLCFQPEADLLGQPNGHSDNHRNNQPVDPDVERDSLENNVEEVLEEITHEPILPYYVEEVVDDNELLMKYVEENLPYPGESEGPSTSSAAVMGLPLFTEPYIMEVQDEHGNVIASTTEMGAVAPQMPNEILDPVSLQISQSQDFTPSMQTPVSVLVLRLSLPASYIPVPELASAPNIGTYLGGTPVGTLVPLHGTIPESQPSTADDYLPQKQHRPTELDSNILATSTEAALEEQKKLLECAVQQNIILQGFLDAFQDSVAHQKEAVAQHNQYMDNITQELQAISQEVTSIGVKMSTIQEIKVLAESTLAALTVTNTVTHAAQAFTTATQVSSGSLGKSWETPASLSGTDTEPTSSSTPENVASSGTLHQLSKRLISRRPARRDIFRK